MLRNLLPSTVLVVTRCLQFDLNLLVKCCRFKLSRADPLTLKFPFCSIAHRFLLCSELLNRSGRNDVTRNEGFVFSLFCSVDLPPKCDPKLFLPLFEFSLLGSRMKQKATFQLKFRQHLPALWYLIRKKFCSLRNSSHNAWIGGELFNLVIISLSAVFTYLRILSLQNKDERKEDSVL